MNRVVKSFFYALVVLLVFLLALFIINPSMFIDTIFTQAGYTLIILMFFPAWFVFYIWPRMTSSITKIGPFGPRKIDGVYIIFLIAIIGVSRAIYYIIFEITDPVYNWLLVALIFILIVLSRFWWKRYY